MKTSTILWGAAFLVGGYAVYRIAQPAAVPKSPGESLVDGVTKVWDALSGLGKKAGDVFGPKTMPTEDPDAGSAYGAGSMRQSYSPSPWSRTQVQNPMRDTAQPRAQAFALRSVRAAGLGS